MEITRQPRTAAKPTNNTVNHGGQSKQIMKQQEIKRSIGAFSREEIREMRDAIDWELFCEVKCKDGALTSRALLLQGIIDKLMTAWHKIDDAEREQKILTSNSR